MDGTFRIARLVRLDRPKPSVNLFATIPSSWVQDRDLVRRAGALMTDQPRGFQHLFNGIFWDGKRFERFVTGPSSLKGHHHGRNGNFWHSVDVAEQALSSGNRYGTMYPPLLILGGLLHDAGKADEYEFDTARGRFVLTNRGKLVGHRQTVIEWIAAARAQHRVVIADAHYLTLIHMLTAMRGVPEWTGIRKPQSLEADALSMADRLSGKGDLHRQMAASGGGFGGYHEHLGGEPWVIRPKQCERSS